MKKSVRYNCKFIKKGTRKNPTCRCRKIETTNETRISKKIRYKSIISCFCSIDSDDNQST